MKFVHRRLKGRETNSSSSDARPAKLLFETFVMLLSLKNNVLRRDSEVNTPAGTIVIALSFRYLKAKTGVTRVKT